MFCTGTQMLCTDLGLLSSIYCSLSLQSTSVLTANTDCHWGVCLGSVLCGKFWRRAFALADLYAHMSRQTIGLPESFEPARYRTLSEIELDFWQKSISTNTWNGRLLSSSCFRKFFWRLEHLQWSCITKICLTSRTSSDNFLLNLSEVITFTNRARSVSLISITNRKEL